MGLYEVALSMSSFGMGTMFTKFHMCSIILLPYFNIFQN